MARHEIIHPDSLRMLSAQVQRQQQEIWNLRRRLGAFRCELDDPTTPATPQAWYIGKASGDISAASSAGCGSGTAIRHNVCWSATTESYEVLNPHDVEIPSGWKVRWTKYPGWHYSSTETGYDADKWIVEPWQYTECPTEE